MTLGELKSGYFDDCYITETTDAALARECLNSKASASWANGPIEGTGWVMLLRWSPRVKTHRPHVLVCRASLLGDQNVR